MQLAIRDLTVRRLDSKGTLYSNLSFEVPHQKVTGLFGANGTGKSTLLRLIAGTTTGLISNGKAAVSTSKPEGYISYAPQNYSASLMPWMSVVDNIALPLDAQHHHKDGNHRAICESLLKRFGVAFSDVPTFRLSGGQQQITVLLRAIAREPDLLLLDEPFSALDIYGGAVFRDAFFEHIRSKRTTTLFVTHDVGELIRFSDRVVLLKSDSQVTSADIYDLDEASQLNRLEAILQGKSTNAKSTANLT